MPVDRLSIAIWRFEAISILLVPGLCARRRRLLIRDISRKEHLWPSGKEGPISRASVYRWYKAYRDDPRIESLLPKAKPKRATASKAVPTAWIEYALALLEEEPRRSLYIITLRLRDRFGLQEAPPKSSLHRALHRLDRYRAVVRRRKRTVKGRKRFRASAPHHIWQADAKATFAVCFVNGRRATYRILSIVDDATRYIVASLLVESESLAAAVKTFRRAAARWGLPLAFYCDRGSCYDSNCFRNGLAVLGVHRINTLPKSPQAHGKIEAIQRIIERWFLAELKHQPVVDEEHLQSLLDAVFAEAYHCHRHSELKCSPAEALQKRRSSREVSSERLHEAFLQKASRTVNKGRINVNGCSYRLPSLFDFEQKVTVYIDPADADVPMIQLPSGSYQKLATGFHTVNLKGPSNSHSEPRVYPEGSLSALLERYRGRELPNASAGFGLPEIYQELGAYLGRHVPANEYEINMIMKLVERGPFAPEAFASALKKTARLLGPGRPLQQVLDQMHRQLQTPPRRKENHDGDTPF